MRSLKGLLAAFALLLLFGCVSYNYIHKVNEDGGSALRIVMNLTKLEAMSQGGATGGANATQGSSLDEQILESCENLTSQNPGVECSYSEGIVTVLKEFSPGAGEYGFEKQEREEAVRYTFTLERLPQLESDGGAAGSSG